MLIFALILTAVSAACIVAGVVSAIVELVLRHYPQSIVASLAVIAFVPVLCIGQDLTTMATQLVAVSP